MPRVQRGQGEGELELGAPLSSLTFIPSGCTLLNLILTGRPNGAWPLGRISNVIGNKSVGKTLVAIEAQAEFAFMYPKGLMFYKESEFAFDTEYAHYLGMPTKRVQFWDQDKEDFDTVEQFETDLKQAAQQCIDARQPGFYVLDSLDALSSKEELAREPGTDTYGTEKAKQMSTMFRKLVRLVGRANMHLMIVSQIRDNIGVTIGRKTTRAGGRALDFYASQFLYLTHIGVVEKTRQKLKRVVGIHVLAKCDKNKTGGPAFRECEFDIRFGYGMADLQASVKWLQTVGRLSAIGMTEKTAKDLVDDIDTMTDDEFNTWHEKVNGVVGRVWNEIESGFLPKRKKRITD